MRFTEQNEQDQAVLEQIQHLSQEELAALDRMRPKNLRHYLEEERPWLEDEIYFLGIELNRPPSQVEIAEAILNQRHSQRFRAFYALRYPEAMLPCAS